MKIILLLLVFVFSTDLAHAQSYVGLSDTPAARLSQQKAVAKYPDIGVADTEWNKAFLDVIKHWKTWKPDQLHRDTWPELVAEEAVSVFLARRREESRRARLGLNWDRDFQ